MTSRSRAADLTAPGDPLAAAPSPSGNGGGAAGFLYLDYDITDIRVLRRLDPDYPPEVALASRGGAEQSDIRRVPDARTTSGRGE